MQANEEEIKEESKVSDNQSVNSAWSEVTNITGVNSFTVGVTSDVASRASSRMGAKYCGNIKTNEKVNEDKEEIDLKKCIIIDNGSTINLFGNPDLVNNIRKSESKLTMSTNAGSKTNNVKAEVPGIGDVWFDKEAIANIFSF